MGSLWLDLEGWCFPSWWTHFLQPWWFCKIRFYVLCDNWQFCFMLVRGAAYLGVCFLRAINRSLLCLRKWGSSLNKPHQATGSLGVSCSTWQCLSVCCKSERMACGIPCSFNAPWICTDFPGAVRHTVHGQGVVRAASWLFHSGVSECQWHHVPVSQCSWGPTFNPSGWTPGLQSTLTSKPSPTWLSYSQPVRSSPGFAHFISSILSILYVGSIILPDCPGLLNTFKL